MESVNIDKRVYGYDILRATAILLVLASHSYFYIFTHVNKAIYYAFVPDGVSLFFVLSGFLIGGILIELVNRPDIAFRHLKNFWIRRWFRTLPAYFCVLSVMIALDIHLFDRSFGYYIRYLFFVQNISNGRAVVYPESWSLAIEEWFYIIVPLASFLLVKLTSCSRKLLLVALIGFIITSVAIVRCYKVYQSGISSYEDWDGSINKVLFMRMDAITFGVLGAWMHYYGHPMWKYKNALFFTGIVLLFYPNFHSYLFGFDNFSLYAELTIKGLSALFLLPKMSAIRSGQGKTYQFVTLTSTVSYSIYLVHFYPFNQFGLTFLRRAGIPEHHTLFLDLIRLLAFFCWTIVLSSGLYKLIEAPFMKLRNRLAKPEHSSILLTKPSSGVIS